MIYLVVIIVIILMLVTVVTTLTIVTTIFCNADLVATGRNTMKAISDSIKRPIKLKKARGFQKNYEYTCK